MKLEHVSVMAVAAALLSTLVACSSDDVYIQTRTDTTSSAEECGLRADVCSLPFDDVEASQRPRAVAALEAVYELGRVTDAMLVQLADACSAIVDASDRPSPAAAPTLEERAVSECTLARDVLASLPIGAVQVEVAAAPACTPLPPPACAFPGTKRETCAPARVTVTVAPGASTETAAVARAVADHFGNVLSVGKTLTQLSAVTSALTGSADALQSFRPGCSEVLVASATRSVGRVENAVTLASGLAAVFSRR